MISRFVQPGELCFDIGAHAGDLTAVMVRAGARVIAVEPQPALVDLLGARFDGNSNVTVVAAGVAAQPGTATLSICRQAPALSTFKQHWKTGRFRDRCWDEEVDVTLYTLDQLVAWFGVPAFTKIDVEGSELDILTGLSQPLPALCFEFACEFMEHSERCVERLLTLGDYRFNYSRDLEFRFLSRRWLSGRELMATMARESGRFFCGDIWADLRDAASDSLGGATL
jgi:FkbM family methyltransferase